MPQLIALNKLGELRNIDPHLYQVIQEFEDKVNQYIVSRDSAAPGTPSSSVADTKYKARAYQNSFQTLPNGGPTKITLDTVDYDPNGNFDVTTNHRWTCPVTGYYDVAGSVKTNATTGSCLLQVLQSGALIFWGVVPASPTQGGWAECADIVYIPAGAYLELWLYQDSGGFANTISGNASTKLAIHLLSV